MTGHVLGPEPVPGLVAPVSLRTAAGSALSVEVSVTNTADRARVLTVGAIGVESSWVSPSQQTPVLDPGQSAVVTLILTPAIGTVPAHYPLAFTAQALDPTTGRPSGTSAATADSVLVVNPRSQLGLVLEPRHASLISTKKVRLRLTNSGEQPARVRIGVQTSPRLSVRFRDQEVEVPPGADRDVKGRVRVPRGKVFGGRKSYSYTVSTRGTESVRHVEGSVTQRALVGTGVLKIFAVLAALSVWIVAAVVFVPQLADRLGQDQSETTAIVDGSSDGAGGGAGDGGGAPGDEPGSGDGEGSGGGGGGAQPAADRRSPGMALSGTVSGRQPGSVTVSLEPTSLVDEEAQRGVGVGVPSSVLGGTGMSLASAFLNRAVAQTPPDRTARTASDGSWAFADVRTPGFYLLTFSKPGYQSQSFVVDSSSEAAAEPLEVELAAGEGSLSGSVTGPRGAVGAATVTITDGTNTITTSTNSKGRVGRWSVSGLSTPGTYVVQVSKPGLSSESRMVELGAGGSATADLRLRHGVASLIGKVRAVDEFGRLTGIGGATVTVTDDEGTVRTATTLTQGERGTRGSARAAADFVGSYTLPGLPVPGHYLVSISGDRLQTQTSEVSLERGQSRASVDADLVSSSGSVAGTVTDLAVTGAAAGLVGVGMTLSNADNVYKTMSTSDPAGGYLFNGVAPGTYTLHSAFFGYQSDQVAVTVRPGRTAQLDRQLAEVEGGVLPARSSVRGRTVDSSTGQPITCDGGPADGCLTASVLETGIDDDEEHTFRTSFLPSEEFTLPDPVTDPGAGLLPGLHTVIVSAPHYLPVVTKVQVPVDSVSDLGTLSLLPAPKVAGTISTAIGAPSANTCIWAIPAGDTSPPPAGCATGAGGSSAECQHSDATFEVGEPGRVCAYVDGTGSYSVEVSTAGRWTVHVVPGDSEYVAPAPMPVMLQPAVIQNQSFVLDRLARIYFTVVAPNASGVISPMAGVGVALDPAPGGGVILQPSTGLTRADGTMEMLRVPDGTYDATASMGGTAGRRDGITVGLNQEVRIRITATEPIDKIIGQVTFNLDGAPIPVPNALVQVIAPAEYADNGAPSLATVSMTTNADGCFLVEDSDSTSPTEPGRDGCSWAAGEAPSRGKQTFVSNLAERVVVDASGFDTLAESTTTLSTDSLNTFVLDPSPMTLGSIVTEVASDDPSVGSFDWEQVTFDVQPMTGPGGSISVGAVGTGTHGQLTWFDTGVGVADRVRAGSYTVTAHHAGYLDGQGVVTCNPILVRPEVAGETSYCVWQGTPLALTQLSSLTVTAQDAASGDVVPNARYTLRRDGGSPQSLVGGAGGVTFTGLDPTEDGYTVQARAAGYSFTSNPATCAAPITLQSGADKQCEVELTRLGAISGTITGTPERPPGSAAVTQLAGASVTIVECTTVSAGACTVVDDTPAFTGTTAGDGTYRITGTLADEGLDLTKDWLVRAAAPGYSMPAAGGALPGALVTSSSFTGGSATADLELKLSPVDVTVVLLEGGTTRFTGATVKLRRNTSAGTEDVQTATVDGTAYRLTDITPGAYFVVAAGGGLLTTTQSVTITADGQVISMAVVRAANRIQGTVTAADLSGSGALSGASVTLCATEPCSTPITLTDGTTGTVTTGTDGYYSIRAVPDGTWWVKVAKSGYRTQVLGPFPFDHLLAALAPVDVRLEPVTRQVTITVEPTWTNNELSAATSVTLTHTDGTVLSTLVGKPASDYVASFSNVKSGCWTVDLVLPAGHYGVFEVEDGPTDAVVTGCTGPKRLIVPTADDADPATASLSLDEGRVDVTVAATAHPDFGHSAPGTVQLVVTKGGTAVATVDDFPVGTQTIWLPSGSGYSVSAQRLPDDDFWPIATESGVSVPPAKPAADAVDVSLQIIEGEATLTVTFIDASPTTSVVLSSPSGATVPAAYASPITVPAEPLVFTLPKGDWTVTATTPLPAGSGVGTESITAPGDYTLAITLTDDP